MVFSYNPEYYVMGHNSNSQQSISVPVLLPGPKVIIETEVLNVDSQGRSGQIAVMLTNSILTHVGPNVGLVYLMIYNFITDQLQCCDYRNSLHSGTKGVGSFVPILFATVKMPVSELFEL